MRYTYEFKRERVDLYRKGKWAKTPVGITEESFHRSIRQWARIEESSAPEALKHKNQNRVWTPEEKLELVSRFLAGESGRAIAYSAGIENGLLYQWVQKYKTMGYNGLVNKKKGRQPKEPPMKQKELTPKPLNESEREELIRLRAEVAYIKAENEVIKKEIALREEKQAALLKAKKQQSSRNSGKKDMT